MIPPRRPRPHWPSYGRVLARRDAHERFAARVMAMHQIREHPVGSADMCCCGSVAVLCPYLRAAHDILGHTMPWDPAPSHPTPPVSA